MHNILFNSVGRRGRLLQDLKKSFPEIKIVATDNSPYAPALYFADKQVLTPRIDDENYIEFILNLCKKENIGALTTLIDPEISILSQNRELFLKEGILPLCPSKNTADLCFDKFKMFQHLKKHEIPSVLTFESIETFEKGLKEGIIEFPVFIKPRTGSGSVGIGIVHNLSELKNKIERDSNTTYIIQELMIGEDLDADVYVDCISNKAVAAFSKKKIETKIGGASKTISFKDDKLFDFIKIITSKFEFYGPLDMDFFYVNEQYYLSEINPRFGGAYIHAYGAGVDFFQFILKNMQGIENQEAFGEYDDDIVMMMYDDVVIKAKNDLV